MNVFVRWHVSERATCGEGSGDHSAGVETPCRLQLDGELCGLGKPLQANPSVLCVENQLLAEKNAWTSFSTHES